MPEIVFYQDHRGRQPVLDYIADVGRVRPAEAAAIERYIDWLEDKGAALGMLMARIIDRTNQIYELRPGAHRVSDASVGAVIVLLLAWLKKSQKLSASELGTAQRRLQAWLEQRRNKT